MRFIRFFGLACLLSTAPAAAQLVPVPQGPEDSATTLIYGTVVPVCTVETDTPLAIVQMGTGAQDVSNVTYTCNNLEGFTRRVSSENGGALVRGTQGIPYLLSQSGVAGLAFAPISLQNLQSDEVATFPELAIGSSGVLRVEIPAIPPRLLAGEYIDTVTIEITPN
ncbi:MAG: hypothetical protein JNM03_02575 [Sphingopyxis sp.]|jgi:hypothetical protein|uniref:hypothetical protein n=1 Tax=Sphingopyxis sp. TaxID=1908224 RepID=UPI001A558E8A|nr:hypothetical protein [Sphingopyxis sp.]MBL9068859.1 hypothetical protein [Sphingopyxis sp.]